MENKEWNAAWRGRGAVPVGLIAYGLSFAKKSALLKMTAEGKRAGGFLPPEREARRVINNQDMGHAGLRELSSCSLSQDRKGKVSYCDLYPVIALTRGQVIYVFSPWLRGLCAASAERDAASASPTDSSATLTNSQKLWQTGRE